MQNITNEVFALASELVRRFSHKDTHECNFALESAEFMSDEDFVYTLPETPHFLEKMGLAEIMSDDWVLVAPEYWAHRRLGSMGAIYQPELGSERKLDFKNSLRFNRMSVRGFYVISFDMRAVKAWYEKQLSQRVPQNNFSFESKPEGWGWLDVSSNTYQFGEMGDFTQEGKIRGSIFKEAMRIFEETPQVISVQALSKRTGIDADRLRIEISAINKRLASYGLSFNGTGDGYYRLNKISN